MLRPKPSPADDAEPDDCAHACGRNAHFEHRGPGGGGVDLQAPHESGDKPQSAPSQSGTPDNYAARRFWHWHIRHLSQQDLGNDDTAGLRG